MCACVHIDAIQHVKGIHHSAISARRNSRIAVSSPWDNPSRHLQGHGIFIASAFRFTSSCAVALSLHSLFVHRSTRAVKLPTLTAKCQFCDNDADTRPTSPQHVITIAHAPSLIRGNASSFRRTGTYEKMEDRNSAARCEFVRMEHSTDLCGTAVNARPGKNIVTF